MELVKGAQFLLILSLFTTAAVLWSIRASRSGGSVPTVRRIGGFDAIEEAVGRATEMGRAVHFSPGIAGVTDVSAPQTFAGLEIMGFTAAMCAKYNAELIVTIRMPEVLPLAEETVRQAFLSAGKPELFKESTVRFISTENIAYSAGVIAILTREQAAANIMVGAYWAESLLMAEAGANAGAIQIAGTANLHQIAFFVAACDYTLIGEELYAGGAYLSKDPMKLGSLRGQDYVKLLATVLVVVGSLLATFGIDALTRLLKL
ncbi:MAG TPA: DUF6754 domain-containing protein [Bacillota bacterium]|nr:DUF6754 domain-containing protein [Bacillota bacterium]